MALTANLEKLIETSKLSFDEMRAFKLGLEALTDKEQQEFYAVLKDHPELIYPLYVHFKAKLKAAKEGEAAWTEAVENEIADLEMYLKSK
jgi:hypothetical protein